MLIDRQIRNFPARAKAYRVADGAGLHININPNGSRAWVFKYKLAGVSGSIGLGSYPEVGAAAARALAEAARVEVKAGRKPAGNRAQAQAEAAADAGAKTTVNALAEAFLEANADRWALSYRPTIEHWLRDKVGGPIGAMAARDVTSAILLAKVIEPEAARSADVARKVRGLLEEMFAWGRPREMSPEINPAMIERRALPKVPPGGHRPAITDLDELRAMLVRIEQWNEATLTGAGFPQIKLANRFLALTAVRPGEVRFARWEEFEGLDSGAPVWRIPEVRMKMKGRGDHVVPLSRQAVDVIREAQKHFGHRKLVFPQTVNPREAISENTIGSFIKNGGYDGKHCAHGWRASFSTIMNDRNRGDAALIEAALAHTKEDQIAGLYNRGTYLDERRALMQAWADLLLAGMPDAATICAGARRAPPAKLAARIAA